MTENMQSVDVIIPTYNAGNQLQDLLESLSGQDYSGAISVIIVDSGSTDQTLEIIKSFTKLTVKLIQIDNKDFTHSYARNLGADKSQAEVLLFMTQDAIPEDDKWLSKMVKPLGEGYAAVSCAEDTSECPDLFYKIGSAAYQKDIGIYNQDKDGVYIQVIDSQQLRKNSSLNNIACCIMRYTFQQYKFRGQYAEDLDLGKRLIQGGYKIKILGTVHVKHYHVRSALYHLKRQYVEDKALATILEHEDRKTITKSQLDWDICQLYVSTIKALKILEKARTYQGLLIRSFLTRQWLKTIEKKKYSKQEVTKLINEYFSTRIIDSEIIEIVQDACSGYGPNYYSPNVTRQIRGYLKYQLEPYIKAHRAIVPVEELNKATIKELARLTGSCIAKASIQDIDHKASRLIV